LELARVTKEDFCDGLEMKLASSLGGTQQARAPKTVAESVTSYIYQQPMLASGWIQVCIPSLLNLHTELKPQP